jgi:hypothetical protein
MVRSSFDYSFRPTDRRDERRNNTERPTDEPAAATFLNEGAERAAACRARNDSLPPRSKSCATAAGSSVNFSHSVQRP